MNKIISGLAEEFSLVMKNYDTELKVIEKSDETAEFPYVLSFEAGPYVYPVGFKKEDLGNLEDMEKMVTIFEMTTKLMIERAATDGFKVK